MAAAGRGKVHSVLAAYAVWLPKQKMEKMAAKEKQDADGCGEGCTSEGSMSIRF